MASERVEPLVINLTGRLCAPLQQKFSDIPVIRLNIASTTLAEDYTKLLRSIARRARDIALVLYCNKAVTPFPNPQNRPPKTSASPSTSQNKGKGKGKKAKHVEEDDGDYADVTKWGHSYFIIELYCDKDYDEMVVQLMICDNNGYLVGFRRCVYDIWSEWYYCSDDFTLPFFLQKDAIKLPMEGDHKFRPKLGGAVTFEDIFKDLGYYPDRRNVSEMELSFLAAVLVFCEARRIVWVFMEVKKRIMGNEAARALDCNIPGREIHEDYAWGDIKDWGVDSRAVLTAAVKGAYRPPSANSGKAVAMEHVKRARFENLIAQGMERGHVGLIMRQDVILAPVGGNELLGLLKNSNHELGLTFREPGFREARPGELDE